MMSFRRLLNGCGTDCGFMVDVAQLVRAPVCGTGGRGFETLHPPFEVLSALVLNADFCTRSSAG